MEQTVNTFSKGLQCDSHPISQGNDSLSDALNATYITMNGNEVILQNDMGNRRVEDAFLPPGYEPVGIKEYGGIIYIAAYNPITNRSQIGSFPSPGRKITNADGGLVLNINFDLLVDGLKSNKKFSDLLGIKNLQSETQFDFLDIDTVIKSFYKYPLHIGDKFSIYGDIRDLLYEGKYPIVSNFYNTGYLETQEKIYSPKNTLFTLSPGVLNS